MKVTELTIAKYRAFDQTTTIPLSDFIVLTGPNNLGKSTVLNALGLLFGSPRFSLRNSVLNNSGYDFNIDYPKQSVALGDPLPPTRISAKLELSDSDISSLKTETGLQEFPDQINLSVVFQLDDTSDRNIFRPHYDIGTYHSGSQRRQVLKWVTERLRYVYIPANRNLGDLRRYLFSELVASAVTGVSNSEERIENIKGFIDDVSKQLGKVELSLAEEMRAFIPDAKSVRIVLREPNLSDLVNVDDVEIDDGAATSLFQKGDGFKSLVSISMLQYIAKQKYGENLIFGIEEPEAHLHSSAIYFVKQTLRQLSRSFQTIITTHSPILIQRDNLQSNVIVQRDSQIASTSLAKPAHNLTEIRVALGVKPQDNMTSAEVVVVVEGATEETCLGHLLTLVNTQIGKAIESGQVRILAANGASKIGPVVQALARDAVSCLVLLDNDNEGNSSYSTIRGSGLIDPNDIYQVPPRVGCIETEFEDMFDPKFYLPEVAEACDLVGFTDEEFFRRQKCSGNARTKMKKWSEVMAQAVSDYGRSWDSVAPTAKTAFAQGLTRRFGQADIGEHRWLHSMASKIAKYLMDEQPSRVY